LVVFNKSDLTAAEPKVNKQTLDGLAVSAKTGAGLEALRAAIIEPFADRDSHDTGLLITDARHYDLLRRAQNALAAADASLAQRLSEELILVGLYDALRYLGEITGETTPNDVLSQIFATFCIGK
jgi:tRNA modification GTPase